MNRQMNILVCEDERLFAAELEETLSQMGHKVVAVAGNASEALEAAEQHSPDLALMDIRLEGEIPGTDVARVLHEQFGIPSIYLTAYADEDTLTKARRANPLGYLVKPVRDRDLKLMLDFGYNRYKMQRKLQTELTQCRTFLDNVNSLEPGSNESLLAQFKTRVKAEAVNSVVGGIAHHLNNALAAAYGYLDWLSTCETVPDFEKTHVKGALEACDRQRSVIQQLMWASQSSARYLKFVKLSEMINEVLEYISPYVPKGIKFETKFNEKTDRVYVDKEAIGAAVTAIVLNAVEAVQGEGAISITLDRTYEEFPERFNEKALPGWYYLLSVKDSGSGIKPENLYRVFEPFFTTRTMRNAAGLGLAVAYGVMQAHSGWITASNEIDRGASIQLFIPENIKPALTH